MMSNRLRFHIDIPRTTLQRRLLAVMSDRRAKEEVHKEIGEYVQDFVPMDSGQLRNSMHYTANSVTWDTPYARYQYEGEVWGPNKPIFSGNTIVGWEDKPLSTRHPTGRELGKPGYWKGWKFGYKTPGTTHHWWEEALQKKGMRGYTNRVTAILKRRARRLNKTW